MKQKNPAERKDQMDLFDASLKPAIPFSDPDTSKAAAQAIAPAADTLRAAVLAWFRDQKHTGGTDAECQEALDLPSHTQTPRRWELCRMEPPLIVKSVRRRKTPAGRTAAVWVATEYSSTA